MGGDLFGVSLNEAKLYSVPIRQSVQCLLRNVEARSGRINRQHIDTFPIVCQPPASATVGRVPTGNGVSTANVGETWQLTEGLEFVNKAVGTIGAGNAVQRPVRVIVGVVKGDFIGEGWDGEGNEGGEKGSAELHSNVCIGAVVKM